jgi:hypothetical protein
MRYTNQRVEKEKDTSNRNTGIEILTRNGYITWWNGCNYE